MDDKSQYRIPLEELTRELEKRHAAERQLAELQLQIQGPRPSVKLLGWDDLVAKGIDDCKATIYRKIKAGRFPPPIYPGKSPAWPEHEIDAYIMGLIAKRDASLVEA